MELCWKTFLGLQGEAKDIITHLPYWLYLYIHYYFNSEIFKNKQKGLSATKPLKWKRKEFGLLAILALNYCSRVEEAAEREKEEEKEERQ